MAERVPPDDSSPLAERTPVVRITVLPGPRGSLGDRIAGLRRRPVWPALIGLAGAVALAAAVVGVGSSLGGGGATAHRQARAQIGAWQFSGPGAEPPSGPGPDDPIEAANRAPLRCVRMVVAAGNPTYALAELDRAASCWRGAAWATTFMHRVDGMWRAVLVEHGKTCPAASLPAVVRADFHICPPRGRVH